MPPLSSCCGGSHLGAPPRRVLPWSGWEPWAFPCRNKTSSGSQELFWDAAGGCGVYHRGSRLARPWDRLKAIRRQRSPRGLPDLLIPPPVLLGEAPVSASRGSRVQDGRAACRRGSHCTRSSSRWTCSRHRACCSFQMGDLFRRRACLSRTSTAHPSASRRRSCATSDCPAGQRSVPSG